MTACGGGGGGGAQGTGPEAAPRVAPRLPQWLVFTADKEVDERREPFAVLDDGSIEPIRLSPLNLAVLQFVVSPDGRQVAFIARADANADGVIDFNDGPGQLYRGPVDGTQPAVGISGPLPGPTAIPEVDWAPDSDALVFRADIDTDDVDEIYMVEAGSATAVKINGSVGTSVEMGDALWSPDSRYVAQVVRNRTNRFIIDRVGINVFDTTLGTPNSTRLTGSTLTGGSTGGSNFSGVYISAGITWAPDSSRLTYMLDDRTNGVRRYLQAFPAGTNKDVIGPLAVDENGSLDFAWSDHSRYLVYEVVRSGMGDGFYVAFADQAGAAVRVNGALDHRVKPFDAAQTTELARAAQGSSTPDHQRIAFLAEPRRSARPWLRQLAGERPVQRLNARLNASENGNRE